MLVRMWERPAARVLDVFSTSAERQGAYDFLENSAISAQSLSASIGEATVMRARDDGELLAVVDGSSLTITDIQQTKDFGAIGDAQFKARGLKLVHAYGVSVDGVPVGLLAQTWWTRIKKKKTREHRCRKLSEKETVRWVDTIEASGALVKRLEVPMRLCFVMDREADNANVLQTLDQSGHDFIVRSCHDRRLVSPDDQREYLRETLANTKPRGHYKLQVKGAPDRQAREARMAVRYRKVTLRVRDSATDKCWHQTVNVVSTIEVDTTPEGEKPLSWILLTNRAVRSFKAACTVIQRYAYRWRIEDLHRTWKSGVCGVESNQLRKSAHVIKWATLMAATAARIERLKMLARSTPEQPASAEFTKYEIMAAIFERRRTKKRTDPEPTDTPTIGEIVRWMADIGGYTGKSSGGPPGSITIARGFERIAPNAKLLEFLEREGKLR